MTSCTNVRDVAVPRDGFLRRRAVEDFASRASSVDAETLRTAGAIVDAVRIGGFDALRAQAIRYGDMRDGDPVLLDADALRAAHDGLPAEARGVLERTADRIRAFATAQRAALACVEVEVPGGVARQRIVPVARAACYAPGGRYPLPSSALMTAVTARVAGVEEVWVASPRPAPITLAASHVAGADGVLTVGGAHAVAALAFGAHPVPACDVIVGPGNRWVTAAKQLVSGTVGIDMLAGPSELLVLADDTADPRLVAADLLAQAEHDDDAVPILVTPSAALWQRVESQLAVQLETLPTAATARRALGNGGAVLVDDIDAGVAACNALAPEHLQVMTAGAPAVAARLERFGALFVGGLSAEVLGDYGAGPNHVLPTGGTARWASGLSVLDFVTVRTELALDDAGAAQALVADATALARLEGLEGHARAAEARAVPAP